MDAIVPTMAQRLDILPTFGLDGDLKLYGENQLASEPFIFADLMDELARLGYDFAVLDLSPGMGRLERAALIAADEAITPMTPETFALDGLEIFAAELAKTTKAMKRGPTYSKVIVNALDERIGQHVAIYDAAVHLQGFTVYAVPVDPAFRKAQALHVPVQGLPAKDAAKTATLAELGKIGEGLCR